MTMTLKSGLAFAVVLTASMAQAEPVLLTIGSGDPSGTYYPVIQEIIDVCTSPTLALAHRMNPDDPTTTLGGSNNNLRGLLRNEIPVGLVQLDKAYLDRQLNPDMARVQALLPLHEESVHVIVPSAVSVMVEEATSGFLGIGGSEAVYEWQSNPLREISDLDGQVVAAWGGSITTANIISTLAGLHLTVMEVANVDAALAALRNGEASAIVATVGFPATWVENLPDGEFSLLSLGDIEEDVEAVYGVSGVSYDNLDQNGQAVPALTVDAILFTRHFEKPEMVSALAELQACVRNNISEFRDTLGTHPAWQRIDPSREMKWANLFVAPTDAAAVPNAAPATANGG